MREWTKESGLLSSVVFSPCIQGHDFLCSLLQRQWADTCVCRCRVGDYSSPQISQSVFTLVRTSESSAVAPCMMETAIISVAWASSALMVGFMYFMLAPSLPPPSGGGDKRGCGSWVIYFSNFFLFTMLLPILQCFSLLATLTQPHPCPNLAEVVAVPPQNLIGVKRMMRMNVCLPVAAYWWHIPCTNQSQLNAVSTDKIILYIYD